MPMKPHADESQSDFVSRCASEMSHAHPDWENNRVVAACHQMWRDKDKTMKAKTTGVPYDGETRSEFLERCIDETGDEDACLLAWDERGAEKLHHRTHASTMHGLEFILSDATPDRMGDIILAEGWDLRNFGKNPIALFNHNKDFPIGRWENLRIDKGALRGHLRLAPEGTSPRIDEIRRLIEADILRAVSVGFRPIESEPRKGFNGELFKRAELVETSLVAVPANPNALAIAKSLNISRDTVAMVFAEQGSKKDRSKRERGFNGGQAENPPVRDRTMSPLTKRIEDTQQRLVRLRDQLTEHLASVDDENPSDADLTTTDEFNERIKAQEKQLAQYQDSEARLAQTSDTGTTMTTTSSGRSAPAIVRPFSLGTKKIDPIELAVRAGTVRALAHGNKEFAGMSLDQVRQRIYGDDEPTRVICDMMLKAAVPMATTGFATWAAELVQQVNAAFTDALYPASVYGPLSGKGVRLTFGRNGRINLPTRAATPSINGSFVAEGAPIPVKRAGFASTFLVPKKMAVITTWSREMDEHSVPAIEGLLRNAIIEDTSIAIDAVLLDATQDNAIRPAGLRYNVSGLTPTAGGGFTALVGDLQKLTGAILTGTNGNIRSMVFIMNPAQALNISLIQPNAPTPLFPFAADINNGRLLGASVIISGTVTAGMVLCVDAADFVSVTGDSPRFEISDQATLHMEDTNPANIGTAGTPNVIAVPTISMFQTDSMALRMVMPMNWAMRRTGVVSWMTGVTW